MPSNILLVSPKDLFEFIFSKTENNINCKYFQIVFFVLAPEGEPAQSAQPQPATARLPARDPRGVFNLGIGLTACRFAMVPANPLTTACS
jgi:hypothetical protein